MGFELHAVAGEVLFANTCTAIAEDSSGDWSTNTSTVNVILTNGFYGYDQNGNLTNDGFKNFAYDDENELIGVWVPNAWSNSFAYDGLMRKRIEQDFAWIGGSWQETNEIHYIYDGNVVVEERNASNVPLVSYTRGSDLSGSLQGAGGIGGLLARTTYGQEIPGAPTTSFYHADGNGNITALMYPNEQLAAKYWYDPFGNMLAMSGPLRDFNKYRFSSKEWDDNSGLYYYGYRFYDPNLQRWPNRDPLGEFGFDLLRRRKSRILGVGPTLYLGNGPDLYLFVKNSPVISFDKYGLDDATCAGCWKTYKNTLNEIAQQSEECLEENEDACEYCDALPPELADRCNAACHAAIAAACSAQAAAEETAAAAALAGCLAGCQPTYHCPPPPPPQPIPCSTCHQNNPAQPFF